MAVAPGPRVLSVRQPWAWAIACGRKKVENRTWKTPYRGTVYIHASSTLDRKAVAWIRRTFGISVPDGLPRCAVIAVAELTDVVTRKTATRFGKWFEGPHGLVFENVRPLPSPVHTLGKLNLFRPSPALVRSVEKQMQLAHPYSAFVTTRIWRRTAKAIADLEANRDITLTTNRAHVIGYICGELAKARLLSRSAATRKPVGGPRPRKPRP
jgi:hypothetical protein